MQSFRQLDARSTDEVYHYTGMQGYGHEEIAAAIATLVRLNTLAVDGDYLRRAR